MSWVKRNLYFLIGGTVAVALLGLAGFYFLTNYDLNNTNLKKLNDAYVALDQFAKANPNPGNKDVDNIEIARQQEALIRSIIDRERARLFIPIPPIPSTTNKVVTKDEFASALRRTVDELEHSAAVASVTIPPKYNFSFEAERSLTLFAPGSLEPLSVQLGEIKALCSILFQAKVNSLDNLRRLRVSNDDLKGPASDYLDGTSLTTPMAVLTPFEISFHCFSTELASVLAGFANDPHGFAVKAINIEPGAAAAAATDASTGGSSAIGSSSQNAKGPQVMVDEKQLKITLVVNLVKLVPKK
jgi:hypothetical protein